MNRRKFFQLTTVGVAVAPAIVRSLACPPHEMEFLHAVCVKCGKTLEEITNEPCYSAAHGDRSPQCPANSFHRRVRDAALS